ncbi:MAG: hypothetical protein K8T25_03560 [Planctomycetia bacterium]|nr:hypothetical protein [Planctomycetia bacterium]
MSDEPLAQMSRDYDEAEIQGIREALEWASEHPEYDFKANLPNVRYCNDDIYRYLVKVLARMKQT